jgi:hypothetical protein
MLSYHIYQLIKALDGKSRFCDSNMNYMDALCDKKKQFLIVAIDGK